jgi:hypothetical protein
MLFRSVVLALVVGSSLVGLGCRGADSPSMDTASEGEECAVGSRTTKTCGGTLHCAPKPYTPVAGGQGPSAPSPEGGNCGGVAGFHCADGLACKIDDKDQLTADAMGTCIRAYACVK